MIILIILSIYFFNLNYFNNRSYNIDNLRLIKIFNIITVQITIIIIIYLLFTIIVVSNIAKPTEGPLRIKN